MAKLGFLTFIIVSLMTVSLFDSGIQPVSAGKSCKDKSGVWHSDGRTWSSGNTIYYCRNGGIYYHSFTCSTSSTCTISVTYAYCKVCKIGTASTVPGKSCTDPSGMGHSDGRIWTKSCTIYWCKGGVIFYHPYTCPTSSTCSLTAGYACCKVCKQ